MIDIPVDESYAFDFLSILSIKLAQGLDTKDYIKKILFRIVDQLDNPDILKEILNSKEYHDLTATNASIFVNIEAMREDGSVYPAREIDKLNTRRHELKQALQSRFFSNPLSEIKTRNEY